MGVLKHTGTALMLPLLLASLVTGKREPRRKCEPITIPMCSSIGYNFTHMPNVFNHDSQSEAGLEVHQFWPLVDIGCSPDLLFFLCSMYTPICIETYNRPLPACRSVCERAQSGCAPLMHQYGFQWPERMRCENLPEFGDRHHLCMDFNSTERQTPPPRPNGIPYKPRPPSGTHPGVSIPPRPMPSPFTPPSGPVCGDCKCRFPLVQIVNTSSPHYGRVKTGGIDNCALPCKGLYFSADEHTFSQFWIGLWAVLCCLSCAITTLTFLVDVHRFKYPERPIIFLSMCYLMVSIGYIIRIVMGHSAVACQAVNNGEIIRYNTTGPAPCTIVFLLVYFFGMASAIWWVILAFSWFLCAGLKWGEEAIASYAQYFHLCAWLVPAVKSIAVLAMSSVDGDPIVGICYVGNQNIAALRGFVLAPLCVYLAIGTMFLMAGFISLVRIRNVIKAQGGQKTDKLERLMVRIGIFSVLYIIPASIVIGCIIYEQWFRDQWERAFTCGCSGYAAAPKPDYSVFMLKYFMILVIGLSSGVWVWSSKTLESWRRTTSRCCGRRTVQYHHPCPPDPPPPPPTILTKEFNPSFHGSKTLSLPLSHV